MIELHDVKKTFRTQHGEVHALDGLSLDIEAGEFVAIRGPSGCGKSTLLSLVGGLTLPSAGRVMVDSLEISAMSSSQRARFRSESVGFVFQLFHLLPYLSVLDNVIVSAPKQDGQHARERAEQLLARFDLTDRLQHRPGQLSVGQRQRVAMARALMNQPKVILADEPTGNLDPANAASLLDILSELNAQGVTILVVTHDQQAADHAQRVVAMERGRVCDAVT
jgi:putative ABC transport system ATP-binding protein